MSSEKSPLTQKSNSAQHDASQGAHSSPSVNVHVSQLSGAGLTDCSDSEEDLRDDRSQASQTSNEHFNVEGAITDAE